MAPAGIGTLVGLNCQITCKKDIINELTTFVREALVAGHGRDEISAALHDAGWPQDEVAEALGRFADVSFPIPVPSRKPSGSAREAFLYLVTFAALYTTMLSVGEILFGLIDKYLPDAVEDRYDVGGHNEGLRWCIAAIVVAFPIYIALTRKHFLEYARTPGRRTSPVRNWLTYATLFTAAMVIIGTLIGLIGSVLGGELAPRSILKMVTAIVLAAAVFAFYLWELRWKEKGPSA